MPREGKAVWIDAVVVDKQITTTLLVIRRHYLVLESDEYEGRHRYRVSSEDYDDISVGEHATFRFYQKPNGDLRNPKIGDRMDERRSR